MTNIYVVVVQGVYRHEVIGAFDNYQLAVAAAQIAAGLEEDGYHSYEVLTGLLNVPVDDMEKVYSCSWQVECIGDPERKRVLEYKKIKLMEHTK